MCVALRLQRFGNRHNPFYRLVAANSLSPRDGKCLERLGTYNPLPSKDQTKEFTANTERIKYWLSVGAQPSDRVAWLFGQIGLLPHAPIRHQKQSVLPKSVMKAKK